MSTSITLVAPGEVVEMVSDGVNWQIVSRGSGALSGSYNVLGGGVSIASNGSFSEVHGFHLAPQEDLILTGSMAPILNGVAYFQHSGILVNVSVNARLPPTGQNLELMLLKNGIAVLAGPLVIPDGLGNTKVYVNFGFVTSPPDVGPQAIPVTGALAAIQQSPPLATPVIDEFSLLGRYVATSGPLTNAQDIWLEMCLQY